MKIVADENIPLINEFFSDIGDVQLHPGRTLSAEQVHDADILLVRSVTKVNPSLLEGSNVKFVGTATIGVDHVDTHYLHQHGIGFSSAPGCNANSVVDYVMSVLSVLSVFEEGERDGVDPFHKTVGIVGCGNVGGLLAKRLKGLGVTCLLCDPPLAEEQAGSDVPPNLKTGYVSLEEALQADVVSLHTPLTAEGDHPTYHLLNESTLRLLKPGAILINSGRGPVIDNQALLTMLEQSSAPTVVLDVWESEPDISLPLLKQVALGTPHIAGYSFDGKCRGTEMIYEAACRFFGMPRRKKMGQFMPEPSLAGLRFSDEVVKLDAINIATRSCYDVRRDDALFRRTMLNENAQDIELRSKSFDLLRKNYPVRREFSTLKISAKNCDGKVLSALRYAGFNLKD